MTPKPTEFFEVFEKACHRFEQERLAARRTFSYEPEMAEWFFNAGRQAAASERINEPPEDTKREQEEA